MVCAVNLCDVLVIPWLPILVYSYLRNAENLKIENEQRHLFKVNIFDRKDDIRPELRTNGIEPIPPFIANQLSHGIICDILYACIRYLLAIGVKIGLKLL